MHNEVHEWIRQARRYLNSVEGVITNEFAVVEIGSRDVNGRASANFGPVRTWLGVDVETGMNVDIVMDGVEYLEGQAGSDWDMVISCEVFEHTESWPQMVRAAFNAVRSDGWLLITCASTGRPPHSAIDGGAIRPGEWYSNVSAEEFQTVAVEAGWTIVNLEVDFRGESPMRTHYGDLFVLCRKVLS